MKKVETVLIVFCCLGAWAIFVGILIGAFGR